MFNRQIRDIVFGMEDGMVSTFGAVTGIAIAAHSIETVIVTGCIVVSVESVSMAIGSYISSQSVRDVQSHVLRSERIELEQSPLAEKAELIDLYVHDGWPNQLARTMAETAAQNPALFLLEMSYREHGISPKKIEQPVRNAIAMLVSYGIGGSIPLGSYLFFSLPLATTISIVVTLVGLLLLGASTARITGGHGWRRGLQVVLLGSIAGGIGYLVGYLGQSLIG
jgi:VIT1/CCC1 family predicted Fe2+/Mn2+ transporter